MISSLLPLLDSTGDLMVMKCTEVFWCTEVLATAQKIEVRAILLKS